MKKKTRKPLSEDQKEELRFKRQIKKAAKELEQLKIDDPADYREFMRYAKAIGKKADGYRKKAKLSIAELSKKACLPEDYVTGIIQGKINLTAIDMYSLAEAMKISIVLLLPKQKFRAKSSTAPSGASVR